MQKTSNYQLNQWEATDKLIRADFNSDNAAIDAALAGKAEKSAVSAVETALANYKSSNDTAVANKASTAEVSALSQSVSALSAALGSGGSNARIAWGSYVGSGKYGAANPNTLNVGFRPVAVWVGRNTTFFTGQSCFFCGMSSTTYMQSTNTIQWCDTGISWYNDSHVDYQFSNASHTYFYIVLGYDAAG